MDALDAILSRPTVPQAKMGPPGPDPDALRRILQAGAAAPDHGKLAPFRFLVVDGDDRAALGELFARAVAAKGAGSEAEQEKQREAPLRAPLIVVVVATVRPDHPKIPAVEQLAAAAAAAQNMLLAAHALGFAGKWSTGKNAYDPVIREGLGAGEHDVVTGFLYLGSPRAAQPPSPRPDIAALARRWPAEAPL